MEESQVYGQELVKCVLVGDNAVGKTRLVCARACRQRSSLPQLLTTHVPTVWAIDQYRMDKEVLENSWMLVDGVNVSLRLWDTFGDHHKDRRFAYGRSDVVLMCFDVGRQVTLDNCRELWFHQIKRFCPNTPILLVGCKNDLRFIYRDPQYLDFCRQKGPLVRLTREQDIVYPDQARAVARELGIPFYETSVLTYFGVNEVFENAIRAAFFAKRQQRFWNSGLRKMLMPTLQEPHCPPRPKLPTSKTLASSFLKEMKFFLNDSSSADLLLVCGNVGFSVHKLIMASCSPLLHRILTANTCSAYKDIIRAGSNCRMPRCHSALSYSSEDSLDTETECLLTKDSPSHQRKMRCGCPFNASPYRQFLLPNQCSCLISLPSTDLSDVKPLLSQSVNHPAIISIHHEPSGGGLGLKDTIPRTTITCTDLIEAEAMNQIIQYAYFGTVDFSRCSLSDLKLATQLLDVRDLFHVVREPAQTMMDSASMSARTLLREMWLSDRNFTDIIFQLEDGNCEAHKSLLMARCEVMLAMFSHDDFTESSAKVVYFPGVGQAAFRDLIYYLYTDHAPLSRTPSNCIDLIELANRFCLPRFVSLIEEAIIHQLAHSFDRGFDVTVDALNLVEACQLHNAKQLSEWCLDYLAQNYNHLCRNHSKDLRRLRPENQARLNLHRWPPIWYLKEFDAYQKSLYERDRDGRKLRASEVNCLCFSRKSTRLCC